MASKTAGAMALTTAWAPADGNSVGDGADDGVLDDGVADRKGDGADEGGGDGAVDDAGGNIGDCALEEANPSPSQPDHPPCPSSGRWMDAGSARRRGWRRAESPRVAAE
eukprot:4164235-Pleurochrysis_carterae.AAC.1